MKINKKIFNSSQDGFTLIEMMVTIAIIAILSAVAVPNMISWRNNMQFNSGLRIVKVAIEKVRMEAIKANVPARLGFTDGGDSFTIEKWDMTANGFATPETIPLPPGVVLDNSNFTNDRLQFNSRGMPVSAIGGTLRLENASGNLCMNLVISNLGSSRIEACP